MTESELLKALNIKKCGVNSCDNLSMPFNTEPYICRKCWEVFCIDSGDPDIHTIRSETDIEQWIKLQND